MWAVSFTFKYLPNIIQRFCTHVAVRDSCALTAGTSHVSSLLYDILTRVQYATCVIGLEGQRVRSRLQLGLPVMPVLFSYFFYGTKIR
jgi:hypothetical protein